MIKQVDAKIVKNVRITPSAYYMELNAPKISAGIKPGQFLHIRIISGAADPLLRRPLSVNRLIRKRGAKGYCMGIVYKVVGKGTRLLAEKSAGEKLDVLGPLGNGFDLQSAGAGSGGVIFICGGMGIAPLVFLAESLRSLRHKPAYITAFIGINTKSELMCAKELKKAGCKVRIATDDGSLGFKGYVSELVEDFLAKHQTTTPKPYIYACGPSPMLKKVQNIASEYNLKGQVSLDEMMGCGIGACLGCVVKAKSSGAGENDSQPVYKRICKDGPVFDIQAIQWED